MTTPDARNELVARYLAELRPQVRHVAGAAILSDAVMVELVAWITLMETEVAGKSRQITAKLEAYRLLLSEGHGNGRVGATTEALALLDVLASSPEVDLTTAARRYGIKPDTLRRAARDRRIEGRLENDRWRLDVASLEEYKARRAG